MIRNGRDAGTSYYFRYGSPVGIVDIALDNEAQYAELVPRAWRVFCVPILFDMIQRWHAGEGVRIGDHEVRDDGIVLKHGRTFRADEWRLFPWSDLKKSANGGVLNFHASAQPEFKAAFVFRDTLNAHVLDFDADRIWQGKAGRLSDIFKEG
jgi:hypothetical protein